MQNTTLMKQRGFSLLELLVAMFIFTVGLLGIAGLQSYSLNNTQITGKQTYAMMYSQDLIDDIRSNASAINSYQLATGSSPSTPAVTCDSTDAGNIQVCTPLERAQYQVYRLYQQVKQSIDGDVDVEIIIDPVVNTSSNVVTINLSWQEKEKTKDPNTNIDTEQTKTKTYSLSALI